MFISNISGSVDGGISNVYPIRIFIDIDRDNMARISCEFDRPRSETGYTEMDDDVWFFEEYEGMIHNSWYIDEYEGTELDDHTGENVEIIIKFLLNDFEIYMNNE